MLTDILKLLRVRPLFLVLIMCYPAFAQNAGSNFSILAENAPVGFASVNAMGQNGTTGGAGGDTITFSTRAEMQVYLFARAKRGDVTPKVISVYGTMVRDATDSGQVYLKGVSNISLIGIGTNASFDRLGLAIINSKNIVVRNIEFRNCKPDCITVSTTSSSSTHHVWIDHCTFSDTPEIDTTGSTHDGLLDITHRSSYITVSWCKFFNHRKTCLLGFTDGSPEEQGQLLTTYHHNWFRDTFSRHPRVRHTFCHVYNNYYDGAPGNFSQMNYGIASTDTARVLVENCYFKGVLNPTKTQEGNSPPGNLLERNNIFVDCGTRYSTGIAFEPASYYAYTADVADSIPSIVMSGAGSGKLGGTATITFPVVSTGAVTSIMQNSAQAGGTVLSDGGAPVTLRGTCWSTAVNPTTADSHTNDGSGTGVFTSQLNGLQPATLYHIRAYAVNSAGTAYGADSTFTTPAANGYPSVSTAAVSTVTTSSATSGGAVTSDGGSNITSRGVCWSASPNPTIADSRTTDGTGTGTFVSFITGLNAGTSYHVRAYATNTTGTAYGQDIQFFTTSGSNEPATAQWPLTANGNATTTGQITAAPQLLSSGGGVLSLIVKDYNAGTTSGGQRCHLGATSWPTETQQNDGRYQQYDISPIAGNVLSITGISFDIGYAATSNFYTNVYYSTDNWVSRTKINGATLNPPNTAWSSQSFTFTASVTAGGVFSIRFYPWLNTSPSTTKYLCVRNLRATATTSAGAGTIAVTLVPQGLYDPAGNRLALRDTFSIFLANASAPFALVDSAKTIIDSLTFTGNAVFSSAASGVYYLLVKHRNTLETWSRAGGEAFLRGGAQSYDFSDSASKAYGANLVRAGSKYCLYAGDVTQDGTVDFSDLITVDNDSYNFVTGYVPTDVNGDNFVDFSDVILVDNISWSWPQVIRPADIVLPYRRR